MDKKELFLESPSGFMMPFVFADGTEVQQLLGYGEQTHPNSGERFDHKGIDFVADHIPLLAVASGTVVGVGNDAVHEDYIITRYGKFEVKYGHVQEIYCRYGTNVVAGQQIAQSGAFLHFEVRVDGQTINPEDFLSMLFGNVAQLESMGIKGHPQLVSFNVPVHTDYDQDQSEIVDLMLRWFPTYLNDMRLGAYQPADRLEQSLRNIFSQAAEKNYFFEEIPAVSNPLGLSVRGGALAGKVQNLIIGDFLSYLATRHNVYVSTWGEAQKKKFMSSPLTAAL